MVVFALGDSMTLSVYTRILVIGAGLLSSHIIQASGQDVPMEELCTPMAMATCYVLYGDNLWDAALGQDADDHFNNTALDIACRAITEKSQCHKINDNCPQKAAMDLTLQEKGYRLMRDFVCDKELFKDFRRALRCEDHEKMRKCDPPPPPREPEQPPFAPKGQRCQSTIDSWVCREQSLQPDCYAPYKRARESYSKVRKAIALLTGCDYDPSAASSEVPRPVTPSAAHPSGTRPSEAPSSEGPPSAGHPSVAPPPLAPLGLFFYIPTLCLLRYV